MTFSREFKKELHFQMRKRCAFIALEFVERLERNMGNLPAAKDEEFDLH
jgi:hypothetical protein